MSDNLKRQTGAQLCPERGFSRFQLDFSSLDIVR